MPESWWLDTDPQKTNMYNLNVNVNVNSGAAGNGINSAPAPITAANLLSVAAQAEVTPRTPEIVNSLIAMTNPFDGYGNSNNNNNNNSSSSNNNNLNGSNSFNSNDRGRLRNDSTSSGEPSPPSIQHTCSQLIKEGLKLTLQTKRRANGEAAALDEANKRNKARKEADNSADDEDDDEAGYTRLPNGLTPEDEERRRRRRERNKIAATKCRLKKREKTVILVQESETLETQNHVLKSQIQELETQRRRLVDMLNLHGPTCIKQQPADIDTTYQQQQQHYPDQQQQQQQPLPNYQENFMPGGGVMTTAGATTTTTTHHHQQPSDCNAIVPDYGPVKVESYDAVQQDFVFATQPQDTIHYATNTTMTTTTNNNGTSNDAGCPV